MQNVPKGLDATEMDPEMCYISKHWGAKCSNTMISIVVLVGLDSTNCIRH